MPINDTQMSTWVTVEDGSVCPDCSKLAGKTMTMGDWIASGILPGNGQTICTDFCRCAIVPVEWAGDFGDTKTVDTSIQKVQEIIEPFQDNLLLRWEVLMEKEVGFSDNPAEDLTKTMQLYNLSQNELAEKFPRRYALIQKILK